MDWGLFPVLRALPQEYPTIRLTERVIDDCEGTVETL
jgi:hypothetical protein